LQDFWDIVLPGYLPIAVVTIFEGKVATTNMKLAIPRVDAKRRRGAIVFQGDDLGDAENFFS
jgi:hypothetical protein